MVTFEATINSDKGIPLISVSKLGKTSFQINVITEEILKDELIDALQEVIDLLEGSFN